jgi:hypothetical protein
MSERYVIQVRYDRGGLRHTQFIEINADSQEDAERLLSEISSAGKVLGTKREMDERVKQMRRRAAGHARAAKLSPERRSEIARLAAQKRWAKAADKSFGHR